MEKSRGHKGTEDYSRVIVRALEEIRTREGIHTQIGFARKLEEITGRPVIHPTNYSRWVNALRKGETIRQVPITPLLTAANAFGYSLDELMNLQSSPGERMEEHVRRLDGLQLQITRLKVVVIHVMRTLIAQQNAKTKSDVGPDELAGYIEEFEQDVSNYGEDEAGNERQA